MKGTNGRWKFGEVQEKRIKSLLVLLIILMQVLLALLVAYKQEEARIMAQEEAYKQAAVRQVVFERSFIFGELYGLVLGGEERLYYAGVIPSDEHEKLKELERTFFEEDFSNEGFSNLMNHYYSMYHEGKHIKLEFPDGCDRGYFKLGLQVNKAKKMLMTCYVTNMISEKEYKRMEEIYSEILRNPTQELAKEYIRKSKEILYQMFC